jgi:anti-sigma B factor antagonist
LSVGKAHAVPKYKDVTKKINKKILMQKNRNGHLLSCFRRVKEQKVVYLYIEHFVKKTVIIAMEVSVQDQGLGYTIKITGELDASSAIALDNTIEQAINASRKDIVIDCTGLDYISSAGIGVFTSKISELEDQGRKIVLFGVSDKVLNVFKILGLDRVLPIFRTQAEMNTLLHANGTSAKG